jgi:hypothetical protein
MHGCEGIGVGSIPVGDEPHGIGEREVVLVNVTVKNWDAKVIRAEAVKAGKDVGIGGSERGGCQRWRQARVVR